MAVILNGTSQYAHLLASLGFGANDSMWGITWGYRNNSSGNYCYNSNGRTAGGAPNNRKFVSGTTTISATTTNNVGTSAAATTANSPSNTTYFPILWEFGGAADRAVTVGNGSRATNTTSNSLSLAPELFRYGATPAASALLAGRIATSAIYSGVPTSQERDYLTGLGVSSNAYHPSVIATDRLVAGWDFETDGTPFAGANAMTFVGSPTFSAAGLNLIMTPPGGGGVIHLPGGMWI